jgi:integrase
VILDLKGKGGRIRTVAVLRWVKQAVDAWTTAAGIEVGPLLRSVSKAGRAGKSLSTWTALAGRAGRRRRDRHRALRRSRSAAHLRQALPQERGDLEQIKFLLGHASIQTTERYLGAEQELEIAVNDNLGT